MHSRSLPLSLSRARALSLSLVIEAAAYSPLPPSLTHTLSPSPLSFSLSLSLSLPISVFVSDVWYRDVIPPRTLITEFPFDESNDRRFAFACENEGAEFVGQSCIFEYRILYAEGAEADTDGCVFFSYLRCFPRLEMILAPALRPHTLSLFLSPTPTYFSRPHSVLPLFSSP